MNYEEIMQRLANGETMDTIAQEMEDMLNKANAELRAQEEAKAKAAEAEAAAEKNEKRKHDLAEAIAACMNEYVVVCGYENPEIQLTDVRETLDGLMELIPMFKNLSIQVATPKKKNKPAPAPTKTTPATGYSAYMAGAKPEDTDVKVDVEDFFVRIDREINELLANADKVDLSVSFGVDG